jgi:hypothetical protein
MPSFLKKHHDTLSTWGFWAVVGLMGIGLGVMSGMMFSGFFAAIAGIVGTLLGFWLGSLLFTGTLKWLNKQNKSAEWPDNYAYTLDPDLVRKYYQRWARLTHSKRWTRLTHSMGTVVKKMVFDSGLNSKNSPLPEEDEIEDEDDNPLEKPKSRHQYIDDGFWNSYYRQFREIWAYTSCLISGFFKGQNEGCSKKTKAIERREEEMLWPSRPPLLADRPRPRPPPSPEAIRIKQKYETPSYI